MRITLSALLFALYSTGCALSESPKSEKFSGWVRFAGEFELYDTEADMKAEKPGACMSGVLPLALQRAASNKFNFSHVSVWGFRVPRWHDPTIMYLDNEGATIVNRCDGDFVIFANRMEQYHR